MKKLLLATAAGALLSTSLIATSSVAAETKHVVKHAAAKHVVKHAAAKKKAVAVAKAEPALEGGEHWSCADGQGYDFAGDLSRDQVVTVRWEGHNYKLPRQQTTTGADEFYDAASGYKLVVIPTKGMLFTDKDGGARLADECKNVAMQGGALAPTQAAALKAGN